MTEMFMHPRTFGIRAPLACEDRHILTLLASCAVQIRRQLQELATSVSIEASPGFDIVFDVYANQQAGRLRTLGSMASATGLASSTATRWVRVLEEKGLVIKQHDEKDRRRIYLCLTVEGICFAEQALSVMHVERGHLDKLDSLYQPRDTPDCLAELVQLRKLVFELPADAIPILLQRAPYALANVSGTTERGNLPCGFERNLTAMIEAGAFESALLLLTRCFQIPWSPWSAMIDTASTASSLDTTRLLFLDMLDTALTTTPPFAELSEHVLERA